MQSADFVNDPVHAADRSSWSSEEDYRSRFSCIRNNVALVDRVPENTSQRVLCVTKRCPAQIEVKQGHSRDEVKSIAATVTEENQDGAAAVGLRRS